MLAPGPYRHRLRTFDTSATAPDSRPAARVRLTLLNAFQLTRDDATLSVSNGLQHLLAYLALQRRSLRRSHVAAALWDDVTDHRAAGNLRSALWRLRQLDLDIVGTNNQCLSLSEGVAVDVYEAERVAKVA